MTTIHVEGMDIDIDPNHWRLFTEYDENKYLTPLFRASKGDNVIYYSDAFGRNTGLPGDRMSIEYVRAVLVGYHEQSRRWLLGLHLAKSSDSKPVFKKIIQWEETNGNENLQEVRLAARTLSLVLTVPLKVFGEKKLPSRPEDPTRSGMTGPLEPHQRKRVDAFEVKNRSKDTPMPIKSSGFTISWAKNGLVLNITRQISGGVETPVFNLVEFSEKDQIVKLIPPTGLLGAFMRSKAKTIPFKRIHNVEVRYVKEEISHSVPSKDKTFMIEQLTTRHIWGLYLTLPDSSLLLVQSVFTQDPELMQTHLSVRAGSKFDTNSAEGIKYFKEHMAEQEKIDEHREAIEGAGFVMGEILNTSVVLTEIRI